LKDSYNIAIKLIKDNKKLHEIISKDLLTKEEISREEFESYFK
jgi:ATP-dependent Zn protease